MVADEPGDSGSVRYSYAAGLKEFQLFSSFQELHDHLAQLPQLACVTAFRQPQLPLRGVVDDDFIARCLSSIPDEAEFLVVAIVPWVYGKASWFHYGDGMSHADLLDELECVRGNRVAAGLCPNWLYDGEDVISAIVPAENGETMGGSY